MLSAVFFDKGSSSEETMGAISQVRKVAGEKTFVSGLSAVVTDTRQLVEDQEAIYIVIAVALCTVVLMLTMDSFLLPLIFLLCIAVSVLWNMGTNYFLGEISYITKAVAAVLQLAVTLDFSIWTKSPALRAIWSKIISRIIQPPFSFCQRSERQTDIWTRIACSRYIRKPYGQAAYNDFSPIPASLTAWWPGHNTY